MHFRTEIELPESQIQISYTDNTLLLGSCFTENIGLRLQKAKFKVCTNPFGILYNPYSIASSIGYILGAQQYTNEDIFEHNQQWHSWDHHGRFSNANPQLLVYDINKELASAQALIQNTNYIFITLGAAHVYRLKENGRIVANCHKVPQKEFEFKMLEAEEISEILHQMVREVHNFKPEIKIIFTISPVKHWAYGALENALGKASLRVAIHKIIKQHQSVFYFPAFELITEDLRDYRFYADDMLHVSDKGIEYVWGKFQGVWISPESKVLLKRLEQIERAKTHRILKPGSVEVQKFAQNTLQEITNIRKLAPQMDFTNEIEYFTKLMG